MPDKAKFEETQFDFGSIDWDKYETYRPPYTAALQDIIFEHHRQHSDGGRLDIALDVGAGGGIVTKLLLDKVPRVVCSDAAPGYVEQARERFSAEAASGRVTLLARKFDEFDPQRDLPDGQPVDMITAGTALHFSDCATVTDHLARALRPGGTFAAFCYGIVPILPAKDEADRLVRDMQDKVIRWMDETKAPAKDHPMTTAVQAKYDNVAFKPEIWRDVRRVKSLMDEDMFPSWINVQPSKVRAEIESLEIVADDVISKTVSYEFFTEYYRNMAPGWDISDLINDDLAKLKEVLGGREVMVKWPLALVMATKR